MTHEEQYDWVYKRYARQPYWAQKEYDIRRQAAEAVKALYEGDKPSVSVLVMSPGRGLMGFETETVVLYRHEVASVGGLEATLMVEEMIRRAMGLSVEAELEQRLATIKGAL